MTERIFSRLFLFSVAGGPQEAAVPHPDYWSRETSADNRCATISQQDQHQLQDDGTTSRYEGHAVRIPPHPSNFSATVSTHVQLHHRSGSEEEGEGGGDGEEYDEWNTRSFIHELEDGEQVPGIRSDSEELLIEPNDDDEDEETAAHTPCFTMISSQVSSQIPKDVRINDSDDDLVYPPPPPPPTSRRESCKITDLTQVFLFKSASSQQLVTDRHRDSDSPSDAEKMNDTPSASSLQASEIRSRLSLPESLQLQTGNNTSDPLLHYNVQEMYHSNSLLERRRSSLPRTEEVMNLLEKVSSQSTTLFRVQQETTEETEELFKESTPVETIQISDAHLPVESGKPVIFSSAHHDEETAVNSASVSSFTTASSDIYSEASDYDYGNRLSVTSSSNNNNNDSSSEECTIAEPVPDQGIVSLESEKPPIGTPISVRICHINTPSDFYVHTDRPAVDLFINHMQVLQSRKVAEERNQKNEDLDVQIGKLYAIRSPTSLNSSDASWSRVKVIDLFRDESKSQKTLAELFYIDYGVTAKLPTPELTALHPDLSMRPGQAIHCYLHNVTGPSGVWSLKAIEEFRNSVSFYSMKALFHEVEKGESKYPVDLYLDWGANEMNNVLLYLSPSEFRAKEIFQQS